jgi:hypothetical protein
MTLTLTYSKTLIYQTVQVAQKGVKAQVIWEMATED